MAENENAFMAGTLAVGCQHGWHTGCWVSVWLAREQLLVRDRTRAGALVWTCAGSNSGLTCDHTTVSSKTPSDPPLVNEFDALTRLNTRSAATFMNSDKYEDCDFLRNIRSTPIVG